MRNLDLDHWNSVQPVSTLELSWKPQKCNEKAASTGAEGWGWVALRNFTGGGANLGSVLE